MNGDWWAFLSRPWTAAILAISFGLLIYAMFGTIKLARRASVIRQQAIAMHKALSALGKSPIADQSRSL
jgi:hypothetical protein